MVLKIKGVFHYIRNLEKKVGKRFKIIKLRKRKV